MRSQFNSSGTAISVPFSWGSTLLPDVVYDISAETFKISVPFSWGSTLLLDQEELALCGKTIFQFPFPGDQPCYATSGATTADVYDEFQFPFPGDQPCYPPLQEGSFE